jgi:branched-chain amino acid transport system permease protein
VTVSSDVDSGGAPAATGALPATPVATRAGASPLRRALPWLVLAAGVAGGFALQTQLYTGQERTLTTVLMFVALAAAWNMIGGYTGYASFGQVGFFGLGGYATAVCLAKLHLSFWLALPASALLAGLFAALVGAPLLRLRGHYFAVATLGVAEGLREVVTNLPDLTGGGAGITLPTVGAQARTPWLGNDGFYVLFLVLAALVVGVGLALSGSRAGYALRAIHQDEDAAASMGINTTVAKTLAFAGSAALTGAVGSAYAFQQVTIFPERLFDVDITVLMVVMVVLGGAGTVVGPVIGAVALAYVSEWLRQNYTTIHTLVLGALIIAAVVLLPQGVANYARDAARTRRFSLLDNVRRYRL